MLSITTDNKSILISLIFLSLFFTSVSEASEIITEKETEFISSGKNHEISARIHTGYLRGEANEYVYLDDYILSQLIWKIDNLYMAGGGISFKPEEIFGFNADLWLKASEGSGEMDDYDWLLYGADWTHWSHHDDTIVTKGAIFDISAEYFPPFLDRDIFRIRSFIGYKFTSFEWEARGGSYIYSSTDSVTGEVVAFRDKTGEFNDGEPGITYRQTYNIPYAGIGINSTIGRLILDARVSGSLMVFGKAVDHHHLRDLVTYAYFYWGQMFSSDLSAGCKLSEHYSLNGTFSYSVYGNLRGNSEYNYSDGSTVNYEDLEGADLETVMFSITVQYNF